MLLNALLAAAGSFDNPARQALIPRLVPAAELGGAIALNLTFFQTALIGGPGLAGLLIAGTGSGWLTTGTAMAALGANAKTGSLALLYALNALSYLAVLWAVATMHTSGKVENPSGGYVTPLASLREGLRFVLTTPLLVWTSALDFFATFFSGAMSLLPIVADRVLGVGAAGYGWLAAAPALGALVGSLYTSLLPLPRRQGCISCWARSRPMAWPPSPTACPAASCSPFSPSRARGSRTSSRRSSARPCASSSPPTACGVG